MHVSCMSCSCTAAVGVRVAASRDGVLWHFVFSSAEATSSSGFIGTIATVSWWCVFALLCCDLMSVFFPRLGGKQSFWCSVFGSWFDGNGFYILLFKDGRPSNHHKFEKSQTEKLLRAFFYAVNCFPCHAPAMCHPMFMPCAKPYMLRAVC